MKGLSAKSQSHSDSTGVRESKPLADSTFKSRRIKNTVIGAAVGGVTGAMMTPGDDKKYDKNEKYANPKDKPKNIPSRAIGGAVGAFMGGLTGYKGTQKRK